MKKTSLLALRCALAALPLLLAHPARAAHPSDRSFFITEDKPVAGAATPVFDGSYEVRPGAIEITVANMFVINRGWWKKSFQVESFWARAATYTKNVSDSPRHAIGRALPAGGFLNLKDLKLVIPLTEAQQADLGLYHLTFVMILKRKDTGSTMTLFAKSDTGIFTGK